MPSIGMYRCPKCHTQYSVREAAARRQYCCGVYLERISAPAAWNVPHLDLHSTPAQADTRDSMYPSSSIEVVEIIPPRENIVDVLAIQMMLNTLATDSLFSLEMAGDEKAQHLLVRGTPEAVAHIRRQLQATYDQITFRVLSSDEDPARASQLPTASAQLILDRPAFLPVQTFSDGDFQKADPLRGLLGAFDGLDAGERALSQIILFPAPKGWSRKYEGSTHQVEKIMSGEAMTMPMFLRQFVTVIGLLVAIGFGLWTLFSFMRHDWLSLMLSGSLFTTVVAGIMYVYSLFGGPTSTDPELVKEKIALPAYDAKIRLFVVGKTGERAHRKLNEIASAYRAVNLQSGNAFEMQLADFDPRRLPLEPAPIWKELTGQVMRLSTGELAALWHLPLGMESLGLERSMVKRILPLPATVEKGILIGHSVHHGKRIPVHLVEETLRHHSFMVAKTQMGKSTLMAHLAAEAMRQDAALVVIDPHGDLVRTLLGLVPPERASDVVYIDFSDANQVVGFNLLDLTQGRSPDKIISNFVHVGELIWKDNWGPRMEDAMRMSLQTLLSINEQLIQEGKRQFTLIDIPALLELETFKVRVIDKYIRDESILQWWAGYYEDLRTKKMNVEVINPVLTKMHRFSEHTAVRNIVGQSSSTVNIREVLDKRQILLINTATGIIGPDAAGLLGAVIMDYINFAVREQMKIVDPAQRTRAVVVIDEFQAIPGVDYPGLLAELQKMGASCILATQALGQLDEIDRQLRRTIISNTATLFAFQTSAEDAELLSSEMDNAVSVTDIINLPDYTCYVKPKLEHHRLPVMYVETLPPQPGNPAVVEKILRQLSRYTRPADVVVADRRQFQDEWYGQEMEDIRAVFHNKSEQARRAVERARANAKSGERDKGVTNPVPLEPSVQEITDANSSSAIPAEPDSAKKKYSAESNANSDRQSSDEKNAQKKNGDAKNIKAENVESSPNPDLKGHPEEADDPRANP